MYVEAEKWEATIGLIEDLIAPYAGDTEDHLYVDWDLARAAIYGATTALIYGLPLHGSRNIDISILQEWQNLIWEAFTYDLVEYLNAKVEVE